MAKKSRKEYMEKIVNAAAVLAVVASLFAAVSWITSGKAGGAADDKKTAALGMMILQLESTTEASNSRVAQQTYLTQAAMYYAYADRATDNENKAILENLGYQSYLQSMFNGQVAENAENKAQTYYDAYENALESAAKLDNVAGNRSTGALIFNVAAVIAECAVLIKRKELLYVFVPIFAIGVYYFTMSLL